MFPGFRIFKRRQSQGHPSVGLAGFPEFLDHVLSIAYGIKQNDDGGRRFRLQRGWIIDEGFRIEIRSGDFSDLPQPAFRMPLHALLIAHGFRNMLLDPVHVVPGQACQRQFHLSAFLQFKGNFPAGGAEADKSRRDGFAGGIGPHARLVRHIGLLRRGKRQQHGREGRKQSGSHSPGNRLPTFGSQEDSSDCTTLDTSLFGRLHSCRGGTEHPNCHHNRKQIFLFVFEPFSRPLFREGDSKIKEEQENIILPSPSMRYFFFSGT